LEKGDTALAERLAHTLKGVAGNIGAKAVQAAAGVLERLIREKAGSADVDVARQKVAALLDPLVGQVRSTCGSPTAEVAPKASAVTAVDSVKSREAAARLMGLLSEYDPGAGDLRYCGLCSQGKHGTSFKNWYRATVLRTRKLNWRGLSTLFGRRLPKVARAEAKGGAHTRLGRRSRKCAKHTVQDIELD